MPRFAPRKQIPRQLNTNLLCSSVHTSLFYNSNTTVANFSSRELSHSATSNAVALEMSVEYEVAEIIRRKKSQYVRLIDTKQWDEFREVALPNAELSFHDTDGSLMMVGRTGMAFTSIGAFTAYFSKFFAKAQTLHMLGNGELERIGPKEVKAIWGMEDQLLLSGSAEVRGGGYY
jgi:hypothetical protein